MKILLLDNYDSFTWNLVHLLEQFDGVEVSVFRNNEIGIEEADRFDRFVLSPGPGIPDEAGVLKPLIHTYFDRKKMLGVCLGMQAIAEVGGGSIFNLPDILHGVSRKTIVVNPADALFYNIPLEFNSARYHSWAVSSETLPLDFRVSAKDEKGVIMAFSHENELIRGVQFHPESILTDFGKQLIDNWLHRC